MRTRLVPSKYRRPRSEIRQWRLAKLTSTNTNMAKQIGGGAGIVAGSGTGRQIRHSESWASSIATINIGTAVRRPKNMNGTKPRAIDAKRLSKDLPPRLRSFEERCSAAAGRRGASAKTSGSSPAEIQCSVPRCRTSFVGIKRPSRRHSRSVSVSTGPYSFPSTRTIHSSVTPLY